mgnify:CR=1 FL=1
MNIEIIFLVFSLPFLFFASIFDLKKREVPDYVSYSFIIGALGISLLYSIYTAFTFFLYALLGAGFLFSLGYFLYRAKQMGGADVKLITALGAVFANSMFMGIPLILFFLLALTLLGSVYTFIWGSVLYLKSFHTANKKAKEVLAEKKSMRLALLLLAFFGLIIIFMIQSKEIQILIGFFILFIILSFYLTVFIHIIEGLHFLKKIRVEELTEGDWLAKDVKINNHLICSAKHPCLDKKQIDQLKKARVEQVTIKIGIPFVPAIFLATLATFILLFFF